MFDSIRFAWKKERAVVLSHDNDYLMFGLKGLKIDPCGTGL